MTEFGAALAAGTHRDRRRDGCVLPLDRFARFLRMAQLGPDLALNLDGGPVGSQAIPLDEYEG